MKKISFNQDWTFQKGTGGIFAMISGASGEAQKVNLPHDAEILTPRNPDEPNGSGNGFFHAENYIYSKDFELKEEDFGKTVFLEFEGVYENAFVYVNKAFAGKHPYGYGNFYLDLTDFVKAGSNNVRVEVKNAVPSGRWYTGGGIYRNVNLMIAERTHIVPDGVKVGTFSLDDDLALIRTETELKNAGLGTRTVDLNMELFGPDGDRIACDTMHITLREGAEGVYRQQMTVEHPCLWDEENPQLCSYKAQLLENGTVLDEEEGTFGIRMISIDSRRGLRVNGKTVKLRGGCLHHDNGVIGTAEFAHAEEFRVRELKKAGFNAIRSSHYPMSRALLEACDRQGMYVMDEFADVWTTTKVEFDYGMHMSDWWEYDLKNIVRKDYNHPCVILYSIGNEIPETGNPVDVQWGKKLADAFRSLDSTRGVTNSMNLMLSIMDRIPEAIASVTGGQPAASAEGMPGEINELMSNMADVMSLVANSDYAGDAVCESAGQVDVSGYNYSAGRYKKDSERYPNRVLVGSETYPGDLDVNWALVEELPNLIGDFDWTAWDYLGEAGIGKISYGEAQPGFSFYASYPTKAAYCGDLNLLGDRRPVSYWREIIWGLRKAPYIAVQPPQHHGETARMSQWSMTNAVRSWNFAGWEGKPVCLEIYSDAPEVEVFVNDLSVGRMKVGEKKKDIAYFETVYTPGTVKVLAVRNGEYAEEDILKTADSACVLTAAADREAIPADGSDICYVEIAFRDKDGILNPEAKVPVTVSVEGPGMILGFGSADPESEENFYDLTAVPFEGRLRAAVRGTGEKGRIIVSLCAEGAGPVKVEIPAE